MSKRIFFPVLFLWLMVIVSSSAAQQKADTTYTFRFVQKKGMFYVPFENNSRELTRLIKCIESNKSDIANGQLPLYVDGYCNSLNSEAKNLATAKIRANRVKSELIIRAGIKEENFITRNHATEGDFVTVRMTVPVKETAATDAEAEARRKAEAERLEAEKRAEQERLAEEQRKAEEARLGEKKAWYLGAMFKAGEFNYKLSDTGKQGNLMGGGITAGYQLQLNKALALDFNLGLGYLNADYEKYEVIDGVRVRRGNETKDWWGPINAGVTLVWKLF